MNSQCDKRNNYNIVYKTETRIYIPVTFVMHKNGLLFQIIGKYYIETNVNAILIFSLKVK